MPYSKQFIQDILKENSNLKKQNEYLKQKIQTISLKLSQIAFSNPLKQENKNV